MKNSAIGLFFTSEEKSFNNMLLCLTTLSSTLRAFKKDEGYSNKDDNMYLFLSPFQSVIAVEIGSSLNNFMFEGACFVLNRLSENSFTIESLNALFYYADEDDDCVFTVFKVPIGSLEISEIGGAFAEKLKAHISKYNNDILDKTSNENGGQKKDIVEMLESRSNRISDL